MVRIFRIFVTVCFFLLIFSGGATAGSDSDSDAYSDECIDIKGKAYTNTIDTGVTLGYVDLKSTKSKKSKKSKGINYKCGLFGTTLPGIEIDENGGIVLSIHHTIVCKDHTQMELTTNATIFWDSPEMVSGSIRETSSIFVVGGPFAGWSGEAVISGTIDDSVLNDLVVEDAFICPDGS